MDKHTARMTARGLRRNDTKSEKILWELLRDRKFKGLKFLRQHPIKFDYNGQTRYFIADFYCADKKLVFEVDGKIHDRQKDYDELRTCILNQLGFKVIRIRNEELDDLGRVIEKLNTLT